MPTITVLPHEQYCPDGAEFKVKQGDNVLECLFAYGIDLPHACEGQGVCGQCHVHVLEGYDTLESPSHEESDTLDGVWDSALSSRLCCQSTVGDGDLVLKIPKYTTHQT